MAIIKRLRGFEPKVNAHAFVAETAVLIGDVEIGEDSSIWYGAVLRGDVGAIRVGKRSNIQDNAVVHATFNKSQAILGDEVTVGHNATIHGAIIHDKVLVGMGATILDNAEIESNTIIAAGALILANTHTEPNSIYAGVPAKKVKELPTDLHPSVIEQYAINYQTYTTWYNNVNAK
ncbi:MAG: gamma carbonic anhydrase family protein [Marinilabiliaceae bacterium]|nr:gamma carbonic anhydrase family protein [Marinilabiliaceae bacterium]